MRYVTHQLSIDLVVHSKLASSVERGPFWQIDIVLKHL
jgi:hypothetical protein